MGVLFIALGALLLAAGLNESWLESLVGTQGCSVGRCPADDARPTFVIMGVSFLAVGLVTSLVTEFALRKTQRLMAQVSSFSTGEAQTGESLANFLGEFGINIDPNRANMSVNERTIDLRGQHSGDVPTDPAGLSRYLQERGITIDEDALKNATIVDTGRSTENRLPAETTPFAESSSDLLRERATIVQKRDRGPAAGGQRFVEFELEVTPSGKPPYRVTVASLVRESLAALLIEGASLNVRVDPVNDNDVTINWGEN